MSVAFGSPLTSANTNASFMSRTQDTNTVGKVDVNNATDSTGKTNGALHTTGGLGVEKKASVNELNVDTLTAQRVLLASSTKDVISSSVTDTELGYVSGASSNLQTQINTKANDASVVHLSGNETIAGVKTFSNDTNLGGNVVVTGNLTVNGTTTSVNSATLDVTDTNITVNNGGNDALSEGAGLTVERTGTHGSLVYANALASKFECGDLGSESEIINASTTQTMTGAKTFTNKINANNELNLSETIDNTSTGASATVPTTTPSVRLTNASLTSVSNIDDVTNGKLVVLTNDTGASITILNDSGGTAIKRILTGTGSNLILEDEKTLLLSYNSNDSRWMIVGGSGSSASGDVVGPASSVDGEIVLFDSTTGKLIKRATGSGFVKATSGVYSTSANVNLSSEVTGTLPFNSVGYESVVTKTTTATLVLTETTVLVDATSASFTVTLPTAVGNTGKVYKIKKINAANAVTIDANGAESIDGYSTLLLVALHDSVHIVSDGTNWQVTSWGIAVALRVGATSSNFNTVEATQVFNTVTTDTHSGYSAGVYTVIYRGFYEIEAQCAPGGTLTTAQSAVLKIRVNGSTVVQNAVAGNGANTNVYPKTSDKRFLIPGDTIDVRGVAGAALTNANSTLTDVFSLVMVGR